MRRRMVGQRDGCGWMYAQRGGEDGGMNGKVDSRMGGQSETQIERQGWIA